MGKPHKKAGAGLSAQTALNINELQMICGNVAAGATHGLNGKIILNTQSPDGMTFSVTATGIGSPVSNKFAVNFLDLGNRRGVSTELTNYKQSQQKVMLIPIAPKKLHGLNPYMNFVRAVADANRKQDPSAEVTINEM